MKENPETFAEWYKRQKWPTAEEIADMEAFLRQEYGADPQ